MDGTSVLLPQMTFILNDCVNQPGFPVEKNVKPIYEKDDSLVKLKYRPILVSDCASKVM